jgi:hypothetical protein
MLGAILFSLCLFAMVYFIGKLIKTWFPSNTYKGKPNDPVASSHRMTELMLKFPDLGIIATHYPDEARTAEAVKEYQALCNSGVTGKEYEDKLAKILSKVDISDIC